LNRDPESTAPPIEAPPYDFTRTRPPSAALEVDRQQVRDFCRGTDKFVMAPCCPRPFERLQFLRGTENVMVDLIEIGVDALNSQVFCMGLEALGGDFRGRITFWGELDRQQLLPHGQRDDIIAAVRRYNECFYDHGGVIAQLEFGPGARPDNVETALAAWDAFPADS
jgi:hypothetical protein